jgi:alkylation response protein AidB-like acyl-CoA dehydrogenase
MSFTLDADQALLRDSIRRFMKSEVTPLIAKHDVERTFPFEIMKELAQFGYIGGRLPRPKAAWAWTSSPGPC